MAFRVIESFFYSKIGLGTKKFLYGDVDDEENETILHFKMTDSRMNLYLVCMKNCLIKIYNYQSGKVYQSRLPIKARL